MSFPDRFQEYLKFDHWLRRCVRKYFRHLRDEQIELQDPRYPTTPPSPFRPRWRLEDYKFVKGELVLHGCEYHMGDYIGGKGAVPIADFIEFAIHQWELDQFESRLNG